MPLIIRLDGKAFHSYTKGCQRPFDEKLMGLMQDTAKYLCENIQGAQVAYAQSDEISILVHDYKKLRTHAWFGKELQKIVSVSAGMASAYFMMHSGEIFLDDRDDEKNVSDYNRLAVFDSRAFVIPEHDVTNYFIWRQQDASRNSLQMLARSMYSHNECNNKNAEDLHQMIHEKGENWDKLQITKKRGSCIIKMEEVIDFKSRVNLDLMPGVGNKGEMTMLIAGGKTKKKWHTDLYIPIFSKDRDYINQHLKTEKE